MHHGLKVIVSKMSIGKSSHVVGRTTMLGICLWIRVVIWQGISGLGRWSNRLGDWKENWMRSGSKWNTPIDTVRTNQNQWQGLGKDTVMAAGHMKDKIWKEWEKTITCNGEIDGWIRGEFKQLVEMQLYKACSAETYICEQDLPKQWLKDDRDVSGSRFTQEFSLSSLNQVIISSTWTERSRKKRLNRLSSKTNSMGPFTWDAFLCSAQQHRKECRCFEKNLWKLNIFKYFFFKNNKKTNGTKCWMKTWSMSQWSKKC